MAFPPFAVRLVTPDLPCYRIAASLMQPWQSRHLSHPLVQSFSRLKHIADLFLATRKWDLGNFEPFRTQKEIYK